MDRSSTKITCKDGAALAVLTKGVKRDSDGYVVQVDFYHKNFSQEEITAFASAPRTRQLTIYVSNISDASLTRILQNLPCLESIMLACCPNVTDAAVSALLEVSKLSWFNSIDTGITDKGAARLRRKFPHARISVSGEPPPFRV